MARLALALLLGCASPIAGCIDTRPAITTFEETPPPAALAFHFAEVQPHPTLRVEVRRPPGAHADSEGTLAVDGLDTGVPAVVPPTAHRIDDARTLVDPHHVWERDRRRLVPLGDDVHTVEIAGLGRVFVRAGYGQDGRFAPLQIADLDPEQTRLRLLYAGANVRPLAHYRDALLVRDRDALVLVRVARAAEPLSIDLDGWQPVGDPLRGDLLLSTRRAAPTVPLPIGHFAPWSVRSLEVAVVDLRTGARRVLGTVELCTRAVHMNAYDYVTEGEVRWSDASATASECSHAVRVDDASLVPAR